MMREDKKTAHINTLRNELKNILGKLCWEQSDIRLSYEVYELMDIVITVLDKIKKGQLKFLSKQDLCLIFVKKANPYCQNITLINRADKDSSTLLIEALPPSDIDSIVGNIFDYLMALPIKYKVTFEIPLFFGEQEIVHETTSMSLSFYESNPNNINALKEIWNKPDLVKKQIRLQGLSCVINGYCNNESDESFKPAWSLLKVIIQQGISKKIFLKRPYVGRDFSFYLSRAFSQKTAKTIPEFFVRLESQSEGADEENRLSLPDHICCFLEQLVVNFSHFSSKEDSQEYLKKFFQDCFNIAYSENMKTIKASCEWLFDSYTYENYSTSMSFLQICFGFEALFTEQGEKEEKLGIMQTIALKCAYLNAKTGNDRIMIQKKLKAIYEVRSGLVHGRKTFLEAKERELLGYGSILLQQSIQKEIQMHI